MLQTPAKRFPRTVVQLSQCGGGCVIQVSFGNCIYFVCFMLRQPLANGANRLNTNGFGTRDAGVIFFAVMEACKVNRKCHQSA